MSEDDRLWTVRSILTDYVRSPSIRHIRDPHSVAKLSREIVNALDRGNSIWGKWDGQREAVLKSAMGCWIPLGDLHAFLNKLPGPNLTPTDVAQRLKAFEEEPFNAYPKEELEAGCLEIYRKENAQGTELAAIIGLLRDHIEQEEERLYLEQQERLQQRREKERIAREGKLLSGADCTWTQLRGSVNWYCRTNGRTYRLSPTREKMWNLFRVNSTPDSEEGDLLGRYDRRGNASKVVAKVAYQPE